MTTRLSIKAELLLLVITAAQRMILNINSRNDLFLSNVMLL